MIKVKNPILIMIYATSMTGISCVKRSSIARSIRARATNCPQDKCTSSTNRRARVRCETCTASEICSILVASQNVIRCFRHYPIFRSHDCDTLLTERTGTVIITCSVRQIWSTGRDVLIRSYTFTHETIREWEARFAPLLAKHLPAMRRGQAGKWWYVDETLVKIHGQWYYLYRAFD